MRLRVPWFSISLARKISILFGAAVLLTIGVTLAFPWLQMAALNEQAMLLQANRIASIAAEVVNLHGPDWTVAQKQLERRWSDLAESLDLPLNCPVLVSVEEADAYGGFRREAVKKLSRVNHQSYYWWLQKSGEKFRYAMAVRGLPTDPHPQTLRGVIDVEIPTARETDRWNLVVTVLAGSSGAVLAILIFYFVTRRLVLSPVESLRRVAEEVARGNTEVRPAIRSGDEFQDLSEAFAKMLARLREAHEEQEKINRSLDVRLGELAETNVALYESNRLKGEFLANVSHELRTPLVSIIGFAELLQEVAGNSQIDTKRLARYSDNILVSGRSLLELINDLLDLAKIEAGKMQLHLSTFSLNQLGQDLIDFAKPLAGKQGLDIEMIAPAEELTVEGDSGKTKQILYNLLSNAIKFTPPGGQVSLHLEAAGEKFVRIRVCDTGPGIPEEKREEVFEKFRQLDSSKTREYEGTGLGLAITRELVLMLGGTIRIKGEEGKGAILIVDLPRKTEAPQRAQSSSSGSVWVGE